MNCREATENLELNAMEALSSQERVAFNGHLELCAECRAQAAELDGQIGQFRRYVQTPSPGEPSLQALRQKIRQEIWASRLKAEKARPRRVILRRVAAAMVICFGLILAWQAVRDKLGGKCACKPWTQEGIASVAGNDTAYPLITDKEVFALLDEPDGKHLVTMDRHTGSRLWKSSFTVAGMPCADSNCVYVFSPADSAELKLAALDRKTGKTVWVSDAEPLPRQAAPSLVVASKQRLCWSDAGNVGVLDIGTGKQLWTRTLAQEGALSLPIADSNRLYVASSDALFALDMATGSVDWQRGHERQGAYVPRPIVQCDGGNVVIGFGTIFGRGLLQCYRAETGAELWKQATDSPTHLLAGRGKIYVRSGRIQAFDGRTGAMVWSVPMGGCSPITMLGDRLYVMEGLDRRGIFALNADTGQRNWDRQLMSSCSRFAISGRMGYLVTQKGELRAIAIRGRS